MNGWTGLHFQRAFTVASFLVYAAKPEIILGAQRRLTAQSAVVVDDLPSNFAAAFPALTALEPDAARAFYAAARTTALSTGQVIFRDGAECSNYVLVLDGSIRVQKIAESGREIVLYRVERGQTCVLTTNCLIAHANYSAEGIAETPVKAVVLPVAAFRALLARSETFREFVFAAYATRISDLLLLIEEVAFGRIDMRLAAWLIGRSGGKGIHTTHNAIASELGTAREVISRQLKEFERQGWVALHRGMIEVCDVRALHRLSEHT